MIKLTEKVTSSPIKSVYPYPTKVKIQGHTQYNTLAHCRVKLAKQRIEATTKTHVAVLDLFNLQSSQESHNNDDCWPPFLFSPPKERRNPDICNTDIRGFASRRLTSSYHDNKVARKVEESEREFNNDYNGGGKLGYK